MLRHTKRMDLIFGSISLIILATSIQIDAQFFTKSNSKSIPRMGRRSDNSLAASQYRHQLIDSLIDEYGPHFVATLEAKSNGLEEDGTRINSQDQGELVFRNDQPFDHLAKRFPSPPVAYLQQPTAAAAAAAAMRYSLDPTGYGDQSRDERSPGAHTANYKDASLAMRALNLNRLMQHLASGGQPLMSYDKLFNGQQQQQQDRGSSVQSAMFGGGGGSGGSGNGEQINMSKRQQKQMED